MCSSTMGCPAAVAVSAAIIHCHKNLGVLVDGLDPFWSCNPAARSLYGQPDRGFDGLRRSEFLG